MIRNKVKIKMLCKFYKCVNYISSGKGQRFCEIHTDKKRNKYMEKYNKLR